MATAEPAPTNPPGFYQYSKGLLLTLCIAFAALWVVITPLATMTSGTGFSDFIGRLGSSLLWGILATVLILDWRGYTWLQGAIRWRNMKAGWRIAAIIGFCLVFYVMLGIYLVRAVLAYRRTSQAAQPATAPAAPAVRTARRSTAVGVASLLIVTACALITYSSAGARQATTGGTPGQQNQTAQHAATDTPNGFATAASTDTPTAAATATPSPIATATATPIPPTPTPKPAPPTATSQPACDTGGAPANPWCYTFNNTGKLIYSPPSNFCSYFTCIPSFWNQTAGYVDQCNDLTFSHSGGRSGACSYHGGEKRPLYQP